MPGSVIYHCYNNLTLIINPVYIFCLCHCSRGHLNIVTFLITTDRADAYCKDRSGETPLHKACE